MRKNKRNVSRWMLVVIGTVVVPAVMMTAWMSSASRMPTLMVPVTTMPSPNAYDYYL